ncbi:Multidrug transporter EmrE [Nitrosomonas sp. Nm58]|nr:Multidrug transporter EmrE [Nitrosomonas sp. Nm58]
MQQINNRHKFILPGYYFRKKFYAQIDLILFLSEFHLTIHCFLMIFCGDTSGDDPIILEGNTMAWVILVLAGLFEVGWAVGLKYTEGFSRFWPTLWTVLAIIASLWLLGIAMKSLPVSTAYSVWVGVGTIGTVILGIVLFEEPASATRLMSIVLIIAGIIGLKLA